MNTEDILEIKALLATPKKIVIVPHKNPDGDAIGSTLGLLHYLLQLNHDAKIIAPNDFPDFLKWLPNVKSIEIHETEKETTEAFINEADIIFTLVSGKLSIPDFSIAK